MSLRWFSALMGVTALAWTAPAGAASDWLEAVKLPADQLRHLCGQADGVTNLARSQIVAAGDADWRRLSRLGLAIESVAMGEAPLDAQKCYVIVRAGQQPEAGDMRRRAFEVRDFASNAARVRVMVVGWDVRLRE